MGKTVDPAEQEIAWFPEEGEYRIVRRKVETVTVGDQEHSFEMAEKGSLVSWVNDAPEDPEDPAGHFEMWTGKPENYRAIRVSEPEED